MATQDDLEELKRQKGDIEVLLSSLESAYADASITEKHYNEVKEKNLKKLEEIKKKIKKLEQSGVKKEPLPGEEEVEEKEPVPEEVPEETKKEEKPAAGVHEKFRDALEKIISEIKPEQDIDRKLEKVNIELEKIKAFIDATKDQKSSIEERMQRLMEEVGEIRSITNSIEGRVSEQGMKIEEINDTIGFLKPQRFTKSLQDISKELKTHEAKIEKLDETVSILIKSINQIKSVLESMGNIENIARLSKDLTKKLLNIEEKEKRIARISDRLDSIFVEMNKRLEAVSYTHLTLPTKA